MKKNVDQKIIIGFSVSSGSSPLSIHPISQKNLLKQPKIIFVTEFIRPVCLPTGKLQDGVTFSAAGWGQLTNNYIFSNVKKILPLPFWTDEKCRNAYKESDLPHKMICAGGEEGVDTCRGDSGGPLTWTKDRIELWGVTSSGNVRCGTKGTPGIYTSVLDHLDWIKSVSKI